MATADVTLLGYELGGLTDVYAQGDTRSKLVALLLV